VKKIWSAKPCEPPDQQRKKGMERMFLI
jgi:hypothetical protein